MGYSITAFSLYKLVGLKKKTPEGDLGLERRAGLFTGAGQVARGGEHPKWDAPNQGARLPEQPQHKVGLSVRLLEHGDTSLLKDLRLREV